MLFGVLDENYTKKNYISDKENANMEKKAEIFKVQKMSSCETKDGTSPTSDYNGNKFET